MFRAVCGIWVIGQEMHHNGQRVVQWCVMVLPYAMPVNITSSFEATAFKPDPDKSGNHDLLCRCRVGTRSLPEVA